MTTTTRDAHSIGHHRRQGFGLLAVAAVAAALLTGCGVVSAIHKAEKTVEGNKATVDAFNSSLQSAPKSFEVTYTTTGSAPAKVVYAVDAPNGLAFTLTPTSGTGAPTTDIVVNSSGEYVCTPPSTGSGSGSGSGSSWTCQKLDKVSAADENNIFDFYTPSHWVTFLNDLGIAAGIAGDKVSNSTMTVNGFTMKCLDLHVSGQTGTSKICTSPQNVLGYVKVATDSTSFEMTSFSTSPPSSLFQLPAGAKVVTATTKSPTTASGTG